MAPAQQDQYDYAVLGGGASKGAGGDFDYSMLGGGKPPTPAAKPAAAPAGDDEDVLLTNLKSGARMVRGAVRGAVSTVQGLASPIRRATGMAPATPPPAETTTAGRIGRVAEQAGEFFLPDVAAAKLVKGAGLAGKVATGAKALATGAGTAAIAAAQGDSHVKTAAAVGAAGPLVEAAAIPAYKALRRGARESLEKVLTSTGIATPQEVRAAVAKVVPTALEDGLKTSWKSWLDQTARNKLKAGATLQSVLEGPAGDALVPVKPLITALDDLATKTSKLVLRAEDTAAGKATLREAAGRSEALADVDRGIINRRPRPGAPGDVPDNPVAQRLEAERQAALQGSQLVSGTITYNKKQLRAIDDLRSTLRQLGDVIPARDLHQLKEDWNALVYKADAFPNRHKLLLSYERKAKDAAARAARGVLDTSAPSIAQLDQAYHRQATLYNVIKRAALGESATTAERAVSRPLGRYAARATGALVGEEAGRRTGAQAGIGAVPGAIVGGLVGAGTVGLLEQAFSSPLWRTYPARARQELADAITSGDALKVKRLVTPLLSAAAAGPSRTQVSR